MTSACGSKSSRSSTPRTTSRARRRDVAAVLFLTSDLMFSSRVVGAAQTLGVPVQLVADPFVLSDKITADCRLVFIDLSLDGLNLPAAVQAIQSGAPLARIVAYGAHVDE